MGNLTYRKNVESHCSGKTFQVACMHGFSGSNAAASLGSNMNTHTNVWSKKLLTLVATPDLFANGLPRHRPWGPSIRG